MTIGEQLAIARRKKGLSIKKAEEATKIRAKFLEALEDDDYDNVPEPVYIKGFIRTYANFLGLNGFKLVKEYNLLFKPEPEPEPEPEKAQPALVPARGGSAVPSKMPKPILSKPEKKSFPWAATLISMILVTIIILGIFGTITPNASIKDQIKSGKDIRGSKIPKKTPPKIKGLFISIVPKSDTWIKVKKDGLLVFIGVRKGKDKLKVNAKHDVDVLTVDGNAIKIFKNHEFLELMSDKKGLCRKIYLKNKIQIP